MSDKEPYELDELIKRCEKIRDDGDGPINFVKAFYTLAKEIEHLQKTVDKLGDIVYGVDE